MTKVDPLSTERLDYFTGIYLVIWPVDVELAPNESWEVTGNYIMDDVRTIAVSAVISC